MKTTKHVIRSRIPRWWLYVNLLTQLTIKKGILNIKPRHELVANKGHKHMVLQEQESHRNQDQAPDESHDPQVFLMLKRTIRVSPNLVDPPSDGTNTRRNRNNIPRADALKSNNLLCHHKVPFGMNNITTRSQLKNSSANAWKTKAVIRPKRTRTQAISRPRRGRWHISRRIDNTQTTYLEVRIFFWKNTSWNHRGINSGDGDKETTGDEGVESCDKRGEEIIGDDDVGSTIIREA
ncbi:hypothetical protein VPH35_013411 [Triticum aestivum]